MFDTIRVPDFRSRSNLGSSLTFSSGRRNSVTTVASHELVETTTDPEVGLANDLAAPLAWYDQAGGEIGDLCNGMQASVRMGGETWAIQKQWSNSAKGCVVGK